MKLRFLIALFFILSSCNFFKSESDEVKTLDAIYKINEWALILNSDNTFKLDEYPWTYDKVNWDCTGKPIKMPSTEIQRIIKMPDSIKGTYYIKNNRLYIDKIYRVITIKIHDFEHDTIFQKLFEDEMQKYKVKQNEEYEARRRKFDEEKRRNKVKNGNIPFLYATNYIFFHYPRPTEKYVSYVYDTIYYDHPSQIDRNLYKEYYLDYLIKSNNNYIDHDHFDVSGFINRNLIRENFKKELQKSYGDMDESQCEIRFQYFINESSRVDSFRFYLSDSCSYDLHDKSKKVLSRINNWPKGTAFGKPVKYYYPIPFGWKNETTCTDQILSN